MRRPVLSRLAGLPLWAQLLGPVLTAVAVVVLLLAGLGERAATRQAEQLSRQRAAAVSDGLLHSAQELERGKTVYADLLATNPDLSGALDRADPVAAGQVLVPRRSRYGLGLVQAVTADGLPLLQLGERPGLDTADLTRSALAGVATSRVLAGDVGLVIVAAAPVKGPVGIVGAVLVGRVLRGEDLVHLAGDDGVVLVVLRRGELVASSFPGPGAELQAALRAPVSSDRVQVDGRRFLISRVATERGAASELVALVPVQDVHEAATIRRRETALLALGLLAVLATTSLLLARRITRPLRRTVLVARQMAGGQYHQRLPPSAIPELDELGGALNDLAAQVADRVDDLHHRAVHDALTGLPNRRGLEDRLAVALCRRSALTGLLFVDLDDFKDVNDSLGHAAGDELLVALSRRLALQARAQDLVVRLGGDEFAVLIEHIADVAELTVLAARLQVAVSEPIAVQGRQLRVTASIGIACAAGPGHAVAELLRDADAAMYAAKRAGKGQTVIFRAEMHAESRRRLGLLADLHDALAREDLDVHYQPVVDLRTGRTTAVEALARWTHPTTGSIPPSTFIPLAEESGAIVALGGWVLRSACAQVRSWQRTIAGAADLRVHVNVSVRQLQAADFLETVSRALAGSGLAARHLVLEITESVFVQGTDVPALLRDLRELGVGLSVDDFGTGYSSLAYLQDHPVDGLKIDRAFVCRLVPDQRNALVESIVAMAEALGVAVVAEGIETVEQLAALRELGCRQGQGYLLGRPADAEGTGVYLRRPRVPVLTPARARRTS